MDLGCFDMGCIETQKKEFSPENESGSSYCSNESVMATHKIGKNKATKEIGHSNLTTLNKCTSQIRKRRTSPISWFPRKKIDSYLQRKIKLLQEVDGMKSTLDETLEDSNPHYSKVLKEKIAAKEAATKAMEARKASMVEASWCRILQAARIECKDAEAQRIEAERRAREAIEAAASHGVIMYDTPDCHQKYNKIETSAIKDGSLLPNEAVSASFETAFEVDKQVAYAVKIALTKLVKYLSATNKDEFKELLRRISQNPDSDGNVLECSESEDTVSESDSDTFKEKEKENKKANQIVGDSCSIDLVQTMLEERLKWLQEDELASLATIVATCGLNAALAEVQNDNGFSSNIGLEIGSEKVKEVRNSITNGQQTKRAETELPSLDMFLVKRLTRLEREVLEAKNARKSENQQNPDKTNRSKLVSYGKDNATELPSLDKYLVKHVSRLEKEVQDAKNRRNSKPAECREEDITVTVGKVNLVEKENVDIDKSRYAEIYDPIRKDTNVTEYESLDKILVKRVSRLEKEKMGFNGKEEAIAKVKKRESNKDQVESLENVLAKHSSRLEKEKSAAAATEVNQTVDDEVRHSVSRRVAREKELQEAWGGLSLGNSIRPHVSRLQRDKAAWLKAEDEEKKRAVGKD